MVKVLDQLAEEDLGDVKRLQGQEPAEWRLRVGPVRVRFAYQGQENELLVLRVLPRGKAYDR